MQTARVTILMSPEKKAAFDAVAAKRGISTGEFFRRAGDRAANDDSAQEEEELAALVRELAEAVPDMQRRLKRSAKLLRESAREVDAMMREAGIRK
jgi:hypothetical protein